MSLLSRLVGAFAGPPPKAELTIDQALEEAVDEVNRLVTMKRALEPGTRIRPWVRTGTRATRQPKLCLGYWDAHNEEFVVTYDGSPS